jgi:hypothetical protein
MAKIMYGREFSEQIGRVLRPTDVGQLERSGCVPDWDVQHWHNVHHLANWGLFVEKYVLILEIDFKSQIKISFLFWKIDSKKCIHN